MLRFQGGQYAVTSEDRLWLLRAVQAEGPPQLAVARALVNGFAHARSKGKWKGTLAGWVRAYAQPVNPRWFVTGDLFKKQLAAAPQQERPELTRRARNRETVHSVVASFDDHVARAVDEALSTACANDVTDYAAPTLDATRKGYIARSVPRLGENRLWTRAAGWTGYLGTGAGGGGGTGGNGGMVALVLLAAAWALVRRA